MGNFIVFLNSGCCNRYIEIRLDLNSIMLRKAKWGEHCFNLEKARIIARKCFFVLLICYDHIDIFYMFSISYLLIEVHYREYITNKSMP